MNSIIQDKIIFREALCKSILENIKTNKIIYIGGHTGWGKTTLVNQLFSHYNMKSAVVSFGDENYIDIFDEYISEEIPNILLDDVQGLIDEEDGIKLTMLIADAPFSTKFFICGRGQLPDFLRTFYTANCLKYYDEKSLALTRKEVVYLLSLYELNIDASTADSVIELSHGWAYPVGLLGKYMDKNKLTEKAIELARTDVYNLFDAKIWHCLSSSIQFFLLNMAHLQTFTEKEACIVCGRKSVSDVIDEILKTGSFLVRLDETHYHFYEIFFEYLQKQQQKFCDDDFRKRHYEATGLYFALENDLVNSLKYYDLAGDTRKVNEILIENANCHIGDSYYYQLEKYYLQLDEDEVLKSPEMMGALAFLHSISLRVEESEYYFKKLIEFEKKLPSSDSRKKIASAKIAVLTISLPHRGISDIAKNIRRISAARVHLQETSITGNMPSIMNGGLDFCEWSKKDRLLYKTMSLPVNLMLGGFAKGVPEIGLGESIFEKNWDGNFTECLMLLNIGKTKSEICNNLQLQFAACGRISRMFMCECSIDTSLDMLQNLLQKVDANAKRQLHSNIEACIAYVHLIANDFDYVENWFENYAPDEQENFFVLERYRYLLKIKIYIIKEMYTQALALLDRLESYFFDYSRRYNYIEARLLRSIVLFRMNDDSWREVLEGAIFIAEEYQFIRLISDFGSAIYEMLQSIENKPDQQYYEHLLTATKKQAICYPKYLSPKTVINDNLTETEKIILSLLVKGLTNDEITKLLGINIAVIKNHTENIYSKLGVKNRSAAIKAAAELSIV